MTHETEMKPYILIKGSYQNIAAFEDKIAQAFEDGYVPAGELQVHPIKDSGKTTDLVLLQSLVINVDDEDEDDEDEYEE
ncbi:MAG: hypothetical protein ACKOAD_07495 [Gammaproteobacteria bacterium]